MLVRGASLLTLAFDSATILSTYAWFRGEAQQQIEILTIVSYCAGRSHAAPHSSSEWPRRLREAAPGRQGCRRLS